MVDPEQDMASGPPVEPSPLNGEYRTDQQGGDDDDDYDPSSFSFDHAQSTMPANVIAQVDSTQPVQAKPFIEEGDDDESEGAANAHPSTSIENGAESNTAQDVPLASEPPQDTAAAAVDAATAVDAAAGLNGSSSTAVPDSAPVAALSTSTPQPSFPSVSAFDPSISQTTPDTEQQGKQQGKAPSPPAPAATKATPQPTHSEPPPPPAASHVGSSLPAPSSTQRLPHDKVGELEDRIKEDPKADTDAWKSLVSHYREKGQLEQARKVYQRFLHVFPNAASVWVDYAQMELTQTELRSVEVIFNASLLSTPNVDLWSLYLDYLRRIHPLVNDTDGARRKILSRAFDLLLETVGIDPDAGKLWRDYVDFVKSGEGVVGGSGWQNQQKTDFVRAAYQRAIKHPHSELTRLWKEYDIFELSVNKATGRKFLQEQSPHYMQARSARMQMDHRLQGLDRTSLPILPPLYGFAGEDEFGTQVEKWRAWAQWEKDDPLVFKDEDMPAYRRRVLYMYKQAVMQLRFYPEIWFEAAMWCFEQGAANLSTEGEWFLDQGIEANPESVLLSTKKADRVEQNLEASNSEEVAIENGKKLELPYEKALGALYALHKKTMERRQKSADQIREQFASAPPEEDPDQSDEDDNDDDSQRASNKPKTRAQQEQEALRAAAQSFAAPLDTLKRTISAVWVAKLRAFRRVQGQGKPQDAKKGFRGVFAEARPRGCLTSDVYVANALMEWYCYHDPSAKKIFEKGLKLFPVDEGFALEYMRFLGHGIGDAVNCRGVFETVVGKILNAAGPEKTGGLTDQDKKRKVRPLLTFMHAFESEFGDLQQIRRVENRMRELFPLEPEARTFGLRFTLPLFDPLEAQLVISPSQARPRPHPAPPQPPGGTTVTGVGTPAGAAASPHQGSLRVGPNGPYLASPKRGLEDSDADTPQRKFARAESPLKGAAGRKIQQHSSQPSFAGPPGVTHGGGGGAGFSVKTFVPSGLAAPGHPVGPRPLPAAVLGLLSLLPSAASYQYAPFDAGRTVDFLRGLNLPNRR